ncbi:MAG TPA: hypothetical protein VL337_10940 [Acidimicrobiales bacterium]|jgi:hypothetical protein|nr:hypothetical protein [Acidimicrobiales bacterium]
MRRVWSILFLAVLATGCSLHDPPASNVRPPKPGVPATLTDVTGIYRSIHQAVLQLRSNGEFVLIVPEGPGPTSGTFTLQDGRLSVVTASCGTTTGEYDVVVSGEQAAGKAVLNIAAVDDQCDSRRHYLTVDPWVYADS